VWPRPPLFRRQRRGTGFRHSAGAAAAEFFRQLERGADEQADFRESVRTPALPVPVDNFFEWKNTRNGKQLYAIARADRGIMALAGLWENWRLPAGEWVRSFAIVTTTPNELCAEIHNRMPAILKPEAWPYGSARRCRTYRI
jgi:putative SOS response-associated peptidase YedK